MTNEKFHINHIGEGNTWETKAFDEMTKEDFYWLLTKTQRRLKEVSVELWSLQGVIKSKEQATRILQAGEHGFSITN
tara:strand:+ start:319 stop:549 length:231 start_codon:yes stop_codon:yes gene_type:complete